ncbi:Na+-transporting NADH:ubiquinone oxidoreductase subunit C [Catalinimonas alkaloidigena]|uniref:Na(+)-translocating NADH-quinone reductase subunit C n=1 Tax=Catalinimonas alkaloidigena TaxID=1075417 RepID=A0A1G9GMZ2_9BACT|nr:NADH:ubiquinone reductase (Na(+)-transporting) subunit C [Catalinimonas alkaloidigena]SDL02028.1 Na+-transporting NADH:ubiquinone oxidoreductase subunit C [Catalinimonas alkaloidigena]
MQQSNGYVIGFSAGLTIILGGLLALAATSLKPAQRKALDLDTKTQILSAVMDIDKSKDDVLGLYERRIKSTVVDINGNEVTTGPDGSPIVAEKVEIGGEYKKAPEQRLYPVFMLTEEGDSSKVESYILPMYGNGLWDKIWGFVALEKDLNTIRGVVFDHKSETPGLGARIAERYLQARYKGKHIYDESGDLVSVTMVKGESGNDTNYDDFHVDGMSGATLTGKGVNNMLQAYLSYYEPFIKKVQGGDQPTSPGKEVPAPPSEPVHNVDSTSLSLNN